MTKVVARRADSFAEQTASEGRAEYDLGKLLRAWPERIRRESL